MHAITVCFAIVCIFNIVKKEMERIHDEIREQLPQKLIIPRYQLRILDTIGHGKQYLKYNYIVFFEDKLATY